MKRPRWLKKAGVASRGNLPGTYSLLGNRERGVVLRRHQEWSLDEFYELADSCNAVRKSIQTLKDYVFKEGYEWEKAYSKKCAECAHEHEEGENVIFCVNCGSRDLHEPDQLVVRDIEKFFDRVDRNGNSLMEVLKMFEEHINIADDAFLAVIKDYTRVDEYGHPIEWTVKELYVPDPRNFKMVVDGDTMVPGGKWWGCMVHRPRGKYTTHDRFIDNEDRGKLYNAPGKCSDCERPLHEIWYVVTESGATDDAVEYFFGDIKLPDGSYAQEVIHASKFSNAYGYGKSPLASVYNLAQTLIMMEHYVKTFYDEERMPRKALVVATSSPDSFRAALKAAQDRNRSQNGHYIPAFTFTPSQNGPSNPIQMLDWSNMPQELQMIEQRKEYYQYIGSAYDVTPIFLGINDASGLQNQGPTQWRVTEKGAQVAQEVYNRKVFPQLLDQLFRDKRFIKGGWNLRLKDVTEKDEMAEWSTKMAEASWAQMMQMFGFKIIGMDADGHIEISQKPDPMAAMGGMGGMMGGGMGGMGAPGGMGGGFGGYGNEMSEMGDFMPEGG